MLLRMAIPACSDPGCIHKPAFTISCGYDEETALASVGPGWSPFVREGLDLVAGRGRLIQVKEKCGGLRLYAEPNSDLPNDEVDRLFEALREIERRAGEHCEDCGARGELVVRRMYYRTLCPTCAAAEGFESLPTEA